MYYIIITHSIYSDDTIPDGAKLLYGLILSLSQRDGYAYADNDYLSRTLNKDARTIQLHLAKLKEKKYIHIDLIENRFRRITTQDTRVKLVPIAKTPVDARKKALKQTVSEPDWFPGYLEGLVKME